MDSAIKLPIDLMQLPTFRQLRELLDGSAEKALFVWFTLWQELGYLAQEGGYPGRLPQVHRPVLLAALAAVAPERERREIIFQHLLTARLLRQDEDGYVCPRFALLHSEMGKRSIAQRGGDMKAFVAKEKHAPAQAFQQSLAMDASRLVDGEGRPLDQEAVKRALWVIIMCDNAFKRERPQWAFSEGLVLSAMEVGKRFSDAEIRHVCTTLVNHSDKVALSGLNTEKLLPKFGEIVRNLEGFE